MKGDLVGFDKITKLSINDNNFIAVQDNKIVKSTDSGIYKTDVKKIHQIEEEGILDVQISPKRFCIQGNDSSL